MRIKNKSSCKSAKSFSIDLLSMPFWILVKFSAISTYFHCTLCFYCKDLPYELIMISFVNKF